MAVVLLVPLCCQRMQRLEASDSRCPAGLIALAARCCAPGQTVQSGHCVGRPRSCPAGFTALESPLAGCVRELPPVHVPAGRFVVGPNDWESEHVKAREGAVAEFWIDALEVTTARYAQCATAGHCSDATLARSHVLEPGLPVVDVTPAEAQAFCAWAGGRLPRSDEWLRVATGETSRRFPWGHTGLVCRRVSYGLLRGPCAEGGNSPDWAGARPDGKSDLGIYDLVGNVAEIVQSAEDQFEARGGSYRSDHAAALKSWSAEPFAGATTDIGFRCVYASAPSTDR